MSGSAITPTTPTFGSDGGNHFASSSGPAAFKHRSSHGRFHWPLSMLGISGFCRQLPALVVIIRMAKKRTVVLRRQFWQFFDELVKILAQKYFR